MAGDAAVGLADVGDVTMDVPSAYREGLPRAEAIHPSITAKYVEYTRVGDPLLDPVMEELRDLDPDNLHRFIGAGIDQRAALKDAPIALRNFFQEVGEPPAWLDYDAHRPARRAFHAYSTNVLVAFVAGVLIEGFSTLISKSFAMTGRVLTPDSARRRLMQNNRHLLEVFFPGGLERNGDGWKLSMRLRFVHARVRELLANSGIWDQDHLGTPISAAHMGFATSVFSARLLRHAAQVGAVFNKEEQESVMQVWRYAGHVMGVPEEILFTDRRHAEHIIDIARACEPPPDADAAAMANALIGAVPLVAGIEDTAEQQRVRQLAYRLSRALIGHGLADQLRFPEMWTFGTLLGFRLKQRWEKSRTGAQGVRSQNFTQMLDISVYDDPNVTYRMPDHWNSRKSNPW
ncbi:MAG: oxygenase MpaB family protein [Gammaproteobacteria bacterium]|nr:oxygenase MpaB family protein [Gammaproteobacteria bacterium]